MKRAFAFVGSPNKSKSNTAAVVRMMLDKLKALHGGMEYELLTAGQAPLRFCAGCWSCMMKGECPLDKTDAMAELRGKLAEADLVVFASPVYTMNVSGQMKTFLDRLCSWYHTLRLAGKPAVTAATTAGSGLKETLDFMEMLLGALGAKTVARLGVDQCYTPGFIADRAAAERAAEEAARAALPYLTGEKKVESDEMMEDCFQAMRAKSVGAKDVLPADYRYWQEHGMLDCASYADLLKKVRSS